MFIYQPNILLQEIKSLAPSPNWLVYFNKAYDSMSMRQSSEVTLKKGISLALTLQKVITCVE